MYCSHARACRREQSRPGAQMQKRHVNAHVVFASWTVTVCFFSHILRESWQFKRAKGARFRIGIDWEMGLVCAWVRGNLIKQADRRRKREWWGDRLMPAPPGMAFTLIPDWEEMEMELSQRLRAFCPGSWHRRMRNSPIQTRRWRTEGGRRGAGRSHDRESRSGDSTKRRWDRKVVSRWWYEETAGGERVGGVRANWHHVRQPELTAFTQLSHSRLTKSPSADKNNTFFTTLCWWHSSQWPCSTRFSVSTSHFYILTINVTILKIIIRYETALQVFNLKYHTHSSCITHYHSRVLCCSLDKR